MIVLLLILGLSFGICMVCTPLARSLACRIGLVDRPDGNRKTHAQETPLGGGMAVLFSSACALVAALVIPNPLRDTLVRQGASLAALLLATVVICAVGLVDDCYRLRARYKLVGQLVAVGVLVACGFVIRGLRLFDCYLELGIFAVPFTVFWLMGAINSLNLIDGMDGMLSTLGLILSATVALMAVLMGQWAPACVAVALAGALLGFLRYNFPPATVFLGDAGSMLVGLVVGVLAIQSSMKGAATVVLAFPIAVLTIPIFDTTAAILRRRLTGRGCTTPDHGHLHHCLLRRGLSSQRVLLCVSSFGILTAAGALVSLYFNNELFALLTVGAVVGTLVVTRLFGHVEFLLVKQCVAAHLARLAPGHERPGARRLELGLRNAPDWDGLWNHLKAYATQVNLKSIELSIEESDLPRGYHAQWDRHAELLNRRALWRTRIPLTRAGRTVGGLQISGEHDDEPLRHKIDGLQRFMESLGACGIVAAEAQAPAADQSTPCCFTAKRC